MSWLLTKTLTEELKRAFNVGTSPEILRAKEALQDSLTRFAVHCWYPYLPMLKHIAWKDVELEQLNPLLDRQMVSGDKIMLARVLLKKGCVVPQHSHENEQVTYILEGALKFWIDGKEIVVRSGEVLCIPSNMPHKAEAVEDTVDLDVFYPPRQDWLNKTDSYLRSVSKE
ncbi:MAG TPA: cupin domain-containing protein [Terriglobales bacterium]|nr:cupin domain-containing protein [Terriglobales bacterium]